MYVAAGDFASEIFLGRRYICGRKRVTIIDLRQQLIFLVFFFFDFWKERVMFNTV